MPYPNRLPFFITLFALGLVSVSQAQDTSPIELDAHVRIKSPAKLNHDEANAVYDQIKQQMAAGYALSSKAPAKTYQEWRQFSSAPYLSSGHGNRYISNFGNELSSSYADLDEGSQMPAGAILAKDSFTVTGDKQVFPGALFLMEKLSEDLSPETGNWRYVMILPEGSVFGDTTGGNPESMEFCHDCHQQVEGTDFLFGIPSRYLAD